VCANVPNEMRILITGLLIYLSLSTSAFGQADCKIFFTYTWTVDQATDKQIELGLPTTDFLNGYTTDKEEESFYFVGLNLNKATLVSHLSSDFCMNRDRIIDKVFKGDKSFYLLKLRTKTDDRKGEFDFKEIKIPIDSLNIFFSTEEKQITIQLPTIKAL
jgi:hypothetical protein